MVAYYKLDHSEPEYRSQMLARADGKWVKRADYETDLAAARAENERLKWERDAYRKVLERSKDEYREDTSRLKGFLGAAVKRAKKAEAERDEARAQVASAFEKAGDEIGGMDPTCASMVYDLTPADARSALQSMQADAERDMRQRAAETARQYDTGEGAYDAILALTLKHADREGGV